MSRLTPFGNEYVSGEGIVPWGKKKERILVRSFSLEHRAEIQKFFERRAHDQAEVFVAEEEGKLVGVAEVSLRSYAEGCTTSPVGYLEGLYVEAPCRRKGIATALVRAAEDWARSQGCTEFASDTEIGNYVSEAMHRALGFEEVERLISFRKQLQRDE